MGKKHKTTVTHLEMTAEPRLPPVPRPRGKYALMRADKPPVHFYRYLYDTIGRNHVWVNRKRLSDAALAIIIQHEEVEIYVLYCGGVPAGYFELDFRAMPRVELSFLGVMPEHIGKGLGRFLLGEAIALAWGRHPNRLIVQTCTLDHPRALPLYQRFGFSPCGQEEVELEELD
ncbi:GCN5-related N-acetyltransferase [Parvibaculum lavamentivorans DS-1]|uniref:GCN5-related N-acetyltransferase n=2 Tax=Parvibaculum lavamentivorans TaxID=256618 RepID=A7HXG2_PARL1|nr:GNAT family N-acetyltransferase [Parvibaculum lavamentivorans]ABS64595.1 GCN5-related N-acetyltransferase [Parvibaculum lavamentivorans DS-1]